MSRFFEIHLLKALVSTHLVWVLRRLLEESHCSSRGRLSVAPCSCETQQLLINVCVQQQVCQHQDLAIWWDSTLSKSDYENNPTVLLTKPLAGRHFPSYSDAEYVEIWADVTAFTCILSHNIPTEAGQSVGDSADIWIRGARKLKTVRGLASVPERRCAVVSVGSWADPMTRFVMEGLQIKHFF